MAQRNETVYPTKLPAKRKLVLAPWQLAINAALESLFGHEINSELASIIRGWISRWSSTRRVERRGKKKKKKDSTMLLSACFSSDHFNKQQTSKHTFPWNLADPLLQPRNSNRAYFRPSRPVSRTSDDRVCQISLKKIIRVNLIFSLVAWSLFTILKFQPDPLFKRLLKVCRVVCWCFM